MIGKVFGILCLVSLIYGLLSGNIAAVSQAALDGAGRAVSLTIGLAGTMALWSGIMRVLESAGAVRRLARLFRPLLRVIFPDACRRENGLKEISSTFAANMLGIGNAATPLAMRAMQRLADNAAQSGEAPPDTASDDMITFAVVNTAAFSLLPSTLLAMRSAAGSAQPFSVIPAVWLCSAAGSITAVTVCRLINKVIKIKSRPRVPSPRTPSPSRAEARSGRRTVKQPHAH